MLLVQIPLHGFGALETELLVVILAADAVGVAGDFKVGALRIGLDLLNHLVQLGLRFVRQLFLAELEIALVLAQHDFVDQPLGSFVELHGPGDGVVCRIGGLLGRGVRTVRRRLRALRLLVGCGCLLIDLGNLAFVLPGAFLCLFHGSAERVDLVIHLSNARPDELLRRACGRTANRDRSDWHEKQHSTEHDRSSYEIGRDCPAMYPLRALTVRSLSRMRTTSGCQPGNVLASNAMRY